VVCHERAVGLAVAGWLNALGTEDKACHEKGDTVQVNKMPTRKELLTKQGMVYYDTITLMKWCIARTGRVSPNDAHF
jgi:hypothetical protein